MKEQIYTIPINDAFDARDGCPLCRLRADMEQKSLDYVLGAAMMEPNVRVQTNKLGFCAGHMNTLAGMKNRLSLALMLESHLNDLRDIIAKGQSGGRGAQATARDTSQIAQSCFICHRVDHFMEKYVENIIFLWKTEPEFKEKLAAQTRFCLPHFSALLAGGQKILSRKDFDVFSSVLTELTLADVDVLRERVSRFCKSFDHRFSGIDLSDAKDSVEQANVFLNGGEAK